MPIITLNHIKRLFFLKDMKSFLFEERSEVFMCDLETQHTALQKVTVKNCLPKAYAHHVTKISS